MRTRSLTVISTIDQAEGTSAGVVTRAVSTLEEVAGLVQASEAAGRDARPAEDASPLVEPYPHDDDWAADPARTSVEVFAEFAPALGAAFGQWRSGAPAPVRVGRHPRTPPFLAAPAPL